jgi:hypothetical protein
VRPCSVRDGPNCTARVLTFDYGQMFFPGTAYALHQVRTLTGETVGIIRWNVQANRWIDGLSKGPQILAWIGIALATYLVVVLACVLTDTPFLDATESVLWVFIFACSGFTGSKIRNGHRQRSQR